MVLAGRVVHDHHHGLAVEVLRGDRSVELLRGGGEHLHLAVAVFVAPGELGRRFAQAEGQDAVDLLHDFDLLFAQGFLLGAAGSQLAERPGAVAELLGEDAAHVGRRVGILGLRHHVGRHHAVLLGHVDKVVPDTAVTDRALEVVHHVAVVDVAVRSGDDVLEEEVALLEEVPERAVVLREIELFDVQFFGCHGAEFVERSEEPAAARAALVGDALDVHLILEIGVQLALVGEVLGQRIDVVVVREHILECHSSGVFQEAALDLLEFVLADSLCSGAQAERQGCSEQECFFHKDI